jgi:hypothetical protein
VPADVALPLSLRFALIDAAGRTAFAASKDVPGTTLDEHQVIVPLPVPAGAYRLRVVAADGPGNIGSVELPVTAELTRAGDFELSDLLVTFAESGGAERFTAGADIPPGAKRLTAVLELHPRGAMPRDVVVRFALLAADDTTTLQEFSSPPAIRGDRWTATAMLSIGMLSEGRYVLRAQIFQGGKRVAEQSRSLRRRRR